jgi:hypothetical protein
VVVALDLEGNGLALAEVDDAGVLAGALQDARAACRKAAQERRGVLVGAVLRPEQREDGELEVVRVAPEQLADTVELPVGQPEGAVERLFGDPRQSFESSVGSGWDRTCPHPTRVPGAGRVPPSSREPNLEKRTHSCRLCAGS